MANRSPSFSATLNGGPTGPAGALDGGVAGVGGVTAGGVGAVGRVALAVCCAGGAVCVRAGWGVGRLLGRASGREDVASASVCGFTGSEGGRSGIVLSFARG